MWLNWLCYLFWLWLQWQSTQYKLCTVAIALYCLLLRTLPSTSFPLHDTANCSLTWFATFLVIQCWYLFFFWYHIYWVEPIQKSDVKTLQTTEQSERIFTWATCDFLHNHVFLKSQATINRNVQLFFFVHSTKIKKKKQPAKQCYGQLTKHRNIKCALSLIFSHIMSGRAQVAECDGKSERIRGKGLQWSDQFSCKWTMYTRQN